MEHENSPKPLRTMGNPVALPDDDAPIASTAKMRDRAHQKKRNRFVFSAFAIVLLILLATQDSPVRVIVSVAVSLGIFMVGLTILGALSRPVPEPPPPGELRAVRLKYRCSSCGTEIKMTLANDAVPESPKHCGELMDLEEAEL